MNFGRILAGRSVAAVTVLLAALALTGTAFAKGNGSLSVNPTNINFGTLTVGQSLTENVVMLNTGKWSVTVASASLSGAGFAVTGLSLPLTLASGQSAAFQVVFAPTNAGTTTGSVTLKKSNGGTLATVSLSGTSIEPTTMQHSVDLNWLASTSAVIGYYVYRGTQTGGPYTRISASIDPSTAYTDSSVSSGQLYYYVVTAVDSNYVESGYSNETAASVPQ